MNNEKLKALTEKLLSDNEELKDLIQLFNLYSSVISESVTAEIILNIKSIINKRMNELEVENKMLNEYFYQLNETFLGRFVIRRMLNKMKKIENKEGVKNE